MLHNHHIFRVRKYYYHHKSLKDKLYYKNRKQIKDIIKLVIWVFIIA